MDGFAKLSNDLITSSLWSEDDKTRIMFITLLAMADSVGFVSGTIPGLSDVARMSLKDGEKAIEKLMNPDPYSRSPEGEGRRLIEADGGFLLTGYAKHRAKRDPEKRRAQNRESQARFRAKKADSKPKISQNKPVSAQGRRQKAEVVNSSAALTSKPSVSKRGVDQSFTRFWNVWPNKVDKGDAKRVWKKLNPSEELTQLIIDAVVAQKKTTQWTKAFGQFQPGPAKWLRAEGLENDVEAMNRGKDAVPRKLTIAEKDAEGERLKLLDVDKLTQDERMTVRLQRPADIQGRWRGVQ